LIRSTLLLVERRTGSLILAFGLLFTLAYLTSILVFPKPGGRLLIGDAVHHYVQLRSLVFDRDLQFRNEYVHMYGLTGGEAGTEWIYEDTPTGHVRNYMPVGPAILWAPLFLLVTSVAFLGSLAGAGWPLDGYARVYQATAAISGIAAAATGVWLSWRACVQLYDRRTAAWATMVLWLSSSTIYYSVISPTYSHAASLLATSAFWYAWISSRNAEPLRRYTLLGALVGLAALMRWQDAILLAPIGLELAWKWRAASRSSRRTVQSGLLALGASLAVFAPQMIVWTVLYGQPFALPQGAGFMRWTEPALWRVLFSDWHGLFTWTPIVAIAILGFVPLWRRDRQIATAAGVFLLLSWYVNAAVADWWAGEAFG
jgi:hypothetical protein